MLLDFTNNKISFSLFHNETNQIELWYFKSSAKASKQSLVLSSLYSSANIISI